MITKKENGVVISDQKEILQEVKSFYQDLYSSKTTEFVEKFYQSS